MNDRVLAKTVTRALLTVLTDISPRSPAARQAIAKLLGSATMKAVGGCPQKALQVMQLLIEVRQELEAEAAGTAQPIAEGGPYVPAQV